MSQIVTKQSLGALATLAFVDIRYEGDERGKPECNLGNDAGEALFDLLKVDDRCPLDLEIKQHWAYAGAFSDGMEFGLAVAATIVTHGLDSDATREAVKAELFRANRYWPDKPNASKDAA